MPDDSDNLLDRILAQSPAAKDAEHDRAENVIAGMIRQSLAGKPGTVIARDAEPTIARLKTEIDRQLSSQLRAIMHHPDFQRLEGTWRGLSHLVMRSETDETLKIKVMNTSKSDLAPAAGAAIRAMLERGERLGLLVGDFSFGRSAEDIAILTAIGSVAEAVQTPFIAAASSDLFGLKGYDDLSRWPDIDKALQVVETAWSDFVNTPASSAVSLTMPRVLARMPYGKETDEVEQFDFEEIEDASDPRQCVWMSAAWVYAARVTEAAAHGGGWNGQAEGLPLHTFAESDGTRASRSTEALVPDSWAFELNREGFLPLVQSADSSYATFLGGPGAG